MDRDVESLWALLNVEIDGARVLIKGDSYVYGRVKAYEFVRDAMLARWPHLTWPLS